MKRYVLGLIVVIILTLGGVVVTRRTHNLEKAPTPATNTLSQTEPTQEKEFSTKPKLTAPKSIEIDLAKNTIDLWQDGKIAETLPVAYQAKEGRWFQTPTGYFKIGDKRERHISSLVGAIMPYSVQLYEDFYIHQIPFFPNGEVITSAYSGGCIRLEPESAKKFYNFADKGTPAVVYKTLGKVKPEFHEPVNLDQFWLRQRFNNPIRQFHEHGGDLDNIGKDYYQHTGIDLAPNENANPNVYAVADGVVVGIWKNGEDDHGLGNTVIIKHGEIYVLYGHLKFIAEWLTVGKTVPRGLNFATVGNTGYGCDYWRIGEDGCESKNPLDAHLHLEIKKAPVLENAVGGLACQNKEKQSVPCWGYTPDDPQHYGYLNPIKELFNDF